ISSFAIPTLIPSLTRQSPPIPSLPGSRLPFLEPRRFHQARLKIHSDPPRRRPQLRLHNNKHQTRSETRRFALVHPARQRRCKILFLKFYSTPEYKQTLTVSPSIC